MYKVNTFITTDKEVAAYEKRISICLTSNGFSFSVATIDGTLLTVGDVTMDLNVSMVELSANVRAFFTDYGVSSLGCQQMVLIAPSERFVWIPAHLYTPGDERRYLEAVSSQKMSQMAYGAMVHDADSYIVFEADGTVVSAFKIALPGIVVQCLPGALVRHGLKERALQHPVLLAHIADGRVCFVAYDKGGLLLTTIRHISDSQQVLYNALDVMKRLDIEKPNMELLLSGNVDRALFASLKGYFPKIDLYLGNPMRFLNPEFQRLHSYRYAAVI